MEKHASLRLEDMLVGKIQWIKRLLVIALISNIFLSWRLWISTRDYPLTPVFADTPSLPYPFDHLLIGVFVGCLVGILLLPRHKIVVPITLFFAGILVISDQGRLQPWFYQYICMFGLFGLYIWKFPKSFTVHTLLASYQFLLAWTYIWSGIGKINPYFPQLFPYFINPLDRFFPEISTFLPYSFWIALPLGEILIGICLLTPLFRIGMVMGIAMHLYILFILGPIGYDVNSIVWLWNATMIGLLYMLFWHSHALPLSQLFSKQTRIFFVILFILFGILPFFSLFGKWDGYLSFALYTGNADYGGIYFDKSLYNELPKSLTQNTEVVENNNYYIGLNAWAYEQLNVPAYPEKRIFIYIAKQVCRYVDNSHHMILIVKERRIQYGNTPKITKYRCTDF